MITPRDRQRAVEVAGHYDDLDRFYLELWGEHVHHGLWTSRRETPAEAVRQLVVEVAAEAGITPGSRVCDVGCGYGATARMLADEYGAQVLGLSLSRAQLDHARRVGTRPDNPRYLLRDWMVNELPSASFDVVLSIESSEHMEDKARFFAEASRVLVPGGRLVVCAWLARDAPGAFEIRHLLEPICREGRLPGMGTEEDYRTLIAGAGLSPARFQNVSARVKKTWPICAQRLVKAVATKQEYRSFLLNGASSNRVFAMTLFRIWAAYELGSMRYGIFRATKPITT